MTADEPCEKIGALMVGGRVVGQVKCDLETEHETHSMTLTWSDEREVDLDLFDVAESFDVEIPDAPLTRDIFGVPIVPGEPGEAPRHNFGP
jgi:hypothetical protein